MRADLVVKYRADFEPLTRVKSSSNADVLVGWLLALFSRMGDGTLTLEGRQRRK